MKKLNMTSHLKDTSLESAMTDDYFAFLMIRSNLTTFSITVSTLGVIFVPFFFYSIIWFGRYGSDKKSTFLNMLTTATFWILIEYNYIIQSTEILRYAIGPLPKWFCLMKTTIRSAYMTQIFLYFDAVALTRYLFIFWLKNPAAFKSDFWILFLNIWIRGASLIFNGVWFIKAEHQIINYYVCSGIDPTEDFKKPLKLYATTELGSVIINVLVWIRVQIYKRTSPKTENQDKRPFNLKKVFLTELNYESLSNFTTSMVNLSMILFLLFGAAYLSKIKPEEMQNYQTAIHLQYLVAPVFVSILFVAVYYLRHEPLQQAVLKKILEMKLDLKEFIARIFVPSFESLRLP